MTTPFPDLAPWPAFDYAEFGPIQTKRLSRMQKLIASFMGRNWAVIPHVTHNDEADITEIDEKRKEAGDQRGTKITIVPILIKILADALAQFPQFNVSFSPGSDEIVMKSYAHIGFAVETPSGLLVPVIRDCDRKSVWEISEEVVSLSGKARDKGLSMAEMAGGCITLTSLGHIGGTGFTPIVNAPEVAILGVSRSQLRPFPGEGGSISWRQMLPLSLSYDHRAINGADAARFCRFIAERLQAADILD